jgi:hypothetical protein
VTLSWTASSDDWYVAGYRIYMDGVAIANTGPTATSHVLDGVPFGSHQYSVAAFDTASPRGPGATIIDQLMSGFGNMYGNLSGSDGDGHGRPGRRARTEHAEQCQRHHHPGRAGG